MKIELKVVSQAGNNLMAEMFFDGIRVTPQGIHCTPAEFEEFKVCLYGGAALREGFVVEFGTPLMKHPLEEMEVPKT